MSAFNHFSHNKIISTAAYIAVRGCFFIIIIIKLENGLEPSHFLSFQNNYNSGKKEKLKKETSKRSSSLERYHKLCQRQSHHIYKLCDHSNRPSGALVEPSLCHAPSKCFTLRLVLVLFASTHGPASRTKPKLEL